MHLFFLSALFVLLSIAGLANASSQPSLQCKATSTPIRFAVRHIEAKGVGYLHGYTTIEGFLSPYEPFKENWIPFVDLRGHVLNDGRFATNAGIGVRYLDFWSNRIWGTNEII